MKEEKNNRESKSEMKLVSKIIDLFALRYDFGCQNEKS